MIRNYITTTLRHLNKHRSYALINLLGLSLGITCSLVLFLLIKFWLSFDTFHAQGNRIYRVVQESKRGEGMNYTPGVPIPFAEAFRNDFSDVANSVFVSALEYEGTLLTVEDTAGNPKNFQEELHIAYTEPAYFHIFDFPLKAGDAQKALAAPNSVVLSEKYAEKYFPGADAVGKTILLNHKTPLVVTGIIQDYPDNTGMQFDVLISWTTIKDKNKGDWGSVSSGDRFYVLLAKQQKPENIDAQLVAFAEKYYGKDMIAQSHNQHYLQALHDMHFDPRFGDGTVSWEMVWILGVAAAFLVFIACVNFVNLATATSVKRAKEVGVRKVLGGNNTQLIWQFLGETFAITLLSVLISLGLTELLLLKINPLLDTTLHLQISDLWLVAYLTGLTLLITLFSGLYPAWVLARIPATQAFHKVLQRGGRQRFDLRRSLIVFQFAVAQVFVIGTLVLFQQMQYIRQADLGFRPDAIVDVRLPESQVSQKKALQNALAQIPAVSGVSLASAAPASGWISITSYKVQGAEESQNTQVKAIDKNYLDLYKIPLLAGEGFNDTDTLSRMVVNETFLKENGWQTPQEALGQMVTIYDRTIPIVGVVKDFHTLSLKEKIEPTILLDYSSGYEMAAIKLQTSDMPGALAAIEKQWSAFYPEYTFDYQFADDEVAEFYDNEEKLSNIISAAALVVIFIGCLGLYGLVTFMAEQKTKEVGVRKVLGASVLSIVQLFSKEFIKLIAIAFVVAAPLSYFMMRSWLQNFNFKITLGAGVFVAGIALTLAIALLTIGYRSVRAALANPVDSLRSE